MKNVDLGENVTIIDPANLYGCKVEDNCFIGPFVEIQSDSVIKKGARISSHSFVCSGVTIGEDTFVAHGVMFINDVFSDSDSSRNWKMRKTNVGSNVRIGSNATILPVNIGDGAIIGAGSVVTKNVPANAVVCGNPAKIMEK